MYDCVCLCKAGLIYEDYSETQRPAAAVMGHAYHAERLDIDSPEGSGWRFQHIEDRGAHDGCVADCYDMATQGHFLVHPAGNAFAKLLQALALMRGGFGIGHPESKVFRLFGVKVHQRLAGPAAVVAIPQRGSKGRVEPQHLGSLPGTQRRARKSPVRPSWRR